MACGEMHVPKEGAGGIIVSKPTNDFVKVFAFGRMGLFAPEIAEKLAADLMTAAKAAKDAAEVEFVRMHGADGPKVTISPGYILKAGDILLEFDNPRAARWFIVAESFVTRTPVKASVVSGIAGNTLRDYPNAVAIVGGA